MSHPPREYVLIDTETTGFGASALLGVILERATAPQLHAMGPSGVL